MRAYPYLFHYGKGSHSTPSELRIGFAETDIQPPLVRVPSNTVTEGAAYQLPEDFWVFSEHWSPRFEGNNRFQLIDANE